MKPWSMVLTAALGLALATFAEAQVTVWLILLGLLVLRRHEPRSGILRIAARLRATILTAVLGFAAASASAQAPGYRITSLGNFEAKGINAGGQVVGTVIEFDGYLNRNFSHAALSGGWTLGSLIQNNWWIGSTSGEAVNDAGDVAGYAFGFGQAFRWTASRGFEVLQGSEGGGFSGFRINNAGQVLALTSQGAVVWDANGTPQPFTLGIPIAINDHGQIAGSTDNGAFVWTPGQGTIAFGSGASAVPTDINNRGQVVGHYDGPGGQRTGFLWSAADGFQPLDRTFGGPMRPQAINDSGAVVGSSDDGFGFIWTAEDGMRDLNTLLDPAATGSFVDRANDINDAGQILARSGYVDLLLNPVPEPGPLVLFALGLCALRATAIRDQQASVRLSPEPWPSPQASG